MTQPNIVLPGPVQTALDLLETAGFEAFVVGGCTRVCQVVISRNRVIGKCRTKEATRNSQTKFSLGNLFHLKHPF